jgi:DNA-binding XRE family transcriptional regulator
MRNDDADRREIPAKSENSRAPHSTEILRAETAWLGHLLDAPEQPSSPNRNHPTRQGNKVPVAVEAGRRKPTGAMTNTLPAEPGHTPATPSPTRWLGPADATRIERRRLALGLSVQGLADLARVDRKTISNIERHKTPPTVRTLFRIADVLEQRAEELVEPSWLA